MASFLSSLLSMFTGSKSGPAPDREVEPQIHNDCRIYPAPIKEGSQFRLAGRIEKDVDGETLVRTFVRADMFTSADDASEYAVRKAQQIIDQNGPSLFSDGVVSRSA
jgi:hypothetical protein